jgi:hypothetical protein
MEECELVFLGAIPATERVQLASILERVLRANL